MARVKLPFTVIDLGGNAVQGASVRVQNRENGVDAVLYTTETGPTTLNNPTVTNAHGRVDAWVDRGAYTASISGTGLQDYEEHFEAVPGGNRTVDTAWLPLGSFAERVTTLPASPIDGQVVCYVGAGAPAGGWYFRYNESSASAYKWEAIGAQTEISASNGGQFATSLTASVAGPLVIHHVAGGTVTPPLEGHYSVRFGIVPQMTSAGTGLVVTANVGRSTAGDTTGVCTFSPFWTFQNTNDYGTLTGFTPSAALLAGQAYVIKSSHGNTASWVSYFRSELAVAPVRVRG